MHVIPHVVLPCQLITVSKKDPEIKHNVYVDSMSQIMSQST